MDESRRHQVQATVALQLSAPIPGPAIPVPAAPRPPGVADEERGRRHRRGCYHVPVSGRGRATRRAASSAGRPSRRNSASASWSTVASVTRSGCRWRIRKSPSMPPTAALRDSASDSEAARGLPSLDVAQGRGQADGDVQDARGGPAISGWVSQPPVMPAGLAGAVDQLPPAFQHLLRGGREQLLLAVEVVVERPEADVGLLGDLGDAGPVPAALGDQPHDGVDEGLPRAGLTPVQPRHPRRADCRYRLRHRCSSCRSI